MPFLDLRKKPNKETVEPSHRETAQASELLHWSADEFPYWPKSKEWFVAVGILSCALIGVSILTKNFLLGVMAPLVFFLLSVYGAKRPRKLTCIITTAGVIIGNRIWKFEELQSFWIFYEPLHKEISIENKALLLPRLSLPLGELDPNTARGILIKFLPEKEHHEPITDIWMRRLRF